MLNFRIISLCLMGSMFLILTQKTKDTSCCPSFSNLVYGRIPRALTYARCCSKSAVPRDDQHSCSDRGVPFLGSIVTPKWLYISAIQATHTPNYPAKDLGIYGKLQRGDAVAQSVNFLLCKHRTRVWSPEPTCKTKCSGVHLWLQSYRWKPKDLQDSLAT